MKKHFNILLMTLLMTIALPAIVHAQYSDDRYNLSGGGGGSSSSKKSSVGYFIDGIVGYDVLKFTGPLGVAAFGGFVYGAAIEPQIQMGQLGLGTHIAFLTGSMSNSANAGTRKETLSSTDAQMTMRLYSGPIFLGVGPGIRYFSLKSVSGRTTTETKYGAYGLRTEIGARIHYKRFNVSPAFQYETLWAAPSNTTGTSRVNSYCVKMGVGFVF